jgi:glycosyltransferase involved in cell wall biosynthesis
MPWKLLDRISLRPEEDHLLEGQLLHQQLHLWGNGDDLPKFQQLVKELSLEKVVLFRPEGYPIQELPRHLMFMDLGVVGNRQSVACDLMLPVKLIEYVSLGIPTIVPRLKTIEHYFSDDMVTYYEPADVRALADAICRLYSEPGTSRKQAERAAQFLSEYGWDRQGNELVTFYRNLLES